MLLRNKLKKQDLFGNLFKDKEVLSNLNSATVTNKTICWEPLLVQYWSHWNLNKI